MRVLKILARFYVFSLITAPMPIIVAKILQETKVNAVPFVTLFWLGVSLVLSLFYNVLAEIRDKK